ncbi:MAG: hypothetical protein KA715_06495 [Xanthomonadaceae bacterium]|nr:hypothetical protein [Xanthomonadaceae bacterium]
MRLELNVQSDRMTDVVLTLSQEERTGLVKKLSGLEGMDEVRIEDSGITVFFKLRAGDSRVLIAKPEPNEWVVTVGLESHYMKIFIEKLEQSQGFKLASFCPVNRVSNASLTLS